MLLLPELGELFWTCFAAGEWVRIENWMNGWMTDTVASRSGGQRPEPTPRNPPGPLDRQPEAAPA
jgi:hypothetical protein